MGYCQDHHVFFRGRIWLLNRFLSLRTVSLIALALFVFGLLWHPHFYLVRDLVRTTPFLYRLYSLLEGVQLQPRNGLFFAFVFVSLGAMLGKNELRAYRAKSVWLFVILFCALSFAEMWLIRYRNNGRNDTYGGLQLSLLPATYFWFSSLAQANPGHAASVLQNAAQMQYADLLSASGFHCLRGRTSPFARVGSSGTAVPSENIENYALPPRFRTN